MNIANLMKCAIAYVLLGPATSFAMGWIPGDGGTGGSHSAPGPVIGLGLPAIVALGGYVWYRRHQRGK